VANGGHGGGGSRGGSSSASRRGSRPTAANPTGVEDRTAQHLRQLELQRKRDLEQAASERDAAVEESVGLKHKVEGLNARNRALTRELKAAKERAAAAEGDLDAERRKVEELLQVTRDAGLFRQAPSSSPRSNPPPGTVDQEEVRALRDKCRAQDATIAHLEERLSSALQRARQGRPLSGSPLPARVIGPVGHAAAADLGGGGSGGASGADGTAAAELYVQIEELKGLRRAEALQVAQLRELCENRQVCTAYCASVRARVVQ
jgi:hypothetical protein